MSQMKASELAADRLVQVITKKHASNPDFHLVMKYKEAATFFDLVPREYDRMLELVGFIQDPRYSENQETKDVPFRRWFPLLVISQERIISLY